VDDTTLDSLALEVGVILATGSILVTAGGTRLTWWPLSTRCQKANTQR